MTKETVTIPKDEYIDLLRCKSALMERALASTKTPPRSPGKPHSWMNHAERAEIMRLTSLGFRLGEISQQIGRPTSTVCRCIRQKKRLKQDN